MKQTTKESKTKDHKKDLAIEKEIYELVKAENKNFTQILYDGIANVFGLENPYQMLALNWPATVLDTKILNWNYGLFYTTG